MKLYKIESNFAANISDGTSSLTTYGEEQLNTWFTVARFPDLPRSLKDPLDPSQTIYSSILYFQQDDSSPFHAIKVRTDSTVVPMTTEEINSVVEAISFLSDVYSIVQSEASNFVQLIDATTLYNTPEYYASLQPWPNEPENQKGVIFTGRGSGIGPLDMNVSYYTEWNIASVAEEDTELYAPATNTIMPYGSGGTGKFDSFGNVFTEGNYTVQVRDSSTKAVLAEYECPLNSSGEEVQF
jgi:hypothetical protein